MLDVTYGVTRRRTFSEQVAEVLQSMDLEGSLFVGYPLFATADDQVTVNALLVSKRRRLVILCPRSHQLPETKKVGSNSATI